jgi:branched-chain amino acid transport system permease protein
LEQFLQQVVNGLATGAIYASLALALVVIYRTTEVINFGQGEMAMFSTYLAWQFHEWGAGVWGAFLLTLVASFALGVGIERIVIRPVERAAELTIVMVTIGLFIVFNGLATLIWSAQPKAPITLFSTGTISIGGVSFAIQELGAIGMTLGVVLLLGAFFRFTKLGLAMRASAVNPDASRLMGVRVGWMLALGWGFAAVLGAVSGVLVAPILASLDPNMMQAVLIFAFAAAVLGGIESPVGAVVGGLAIGVTINLLGTYVDFVTPEVELPAALLLLLVVLLIRPAGLFGRHVARRV